MRLSGFTLIELIIVLALTAIIAGLVYQVLPRAQTVFVDRLAMEFLENDSISQWRREVHNLNFPFERQVTFEHGTTVFDTLWIRQPKSYGIRKVLPVRTYNSEMLWK